VYKLFRLHRLSLEPETRIKTREPEPKPKPPEPRFKKLDLKKLRLSKLSDFMLNFILFQTFCKINLSFFCLIKLCFV
jgi:hypothetical protein